MDKGNARSQLTAPHSVSPANQRRECIWRLFTRVVSCEILLIKFSPFYSQIPNIFPSTVPKKVLKDRFDTPPEPDEPHQNDVDHDHDELYDDDQFYKEPEAIPPEPKLQGDLAKERGTDIIPSIITVQSSSVRPPLRNRDDSSLEGRFRMEKAFRSFYDKFLNHVNMWKKVAVEECDARRSLRRQNME